MKKLYIADENGGYTEAVPEVILSAGAEILESRIVGQKLTDPGATREYFRLRFGALEHEIFACAFLDNRHRIISSEEMFRGTINGASVYPREVVKRALQLNAAAVIFCHNHPSGIAEPSRADESLTKRLSEALELVDCRVLDHIIVCAYETVSFSERGLL